MGAKAPLEVLYLSQWRSGNALKVFQTISKVINSLIASNFKFIVWYLCFKTKVNEYAHHIATSNLTHWSPYN